MLKPETFIKRKESIKNKLIFFFYVILLIGDNMNELHLPVCALFFSTLLCIVYYSKKRLNLIENKIFSIMLISSNRFDYKLKKWYY